MLPRLIIAATKTDTGETAVSPTIVTGSGIVFESGRRAESRTRPCSVRIESGPGPHIPVENKCGDEIRIKSVTVTGIDSETPIEIDTHRYERRRDSFYVHSGGAADIISMGKILTRKGGRTWPGRLHRKKKMLLEDNDLRRLIPLTGPRVKFKYELLAWRKRIQKAQTEQFAESEVEAVQDLTSNFIILSGRENSSCSSQCSIIPSITPESPLTIIPSQDRTNLTYETFDNKFVVQVLNNSVDGQALLLSGRQSGGKLNDHQRRLLGRKSSDSNRNTNNFKHSSLSEQDEIEEADVIQEERLKILHNNIEPWSLIQHNWQITTELRFKKLAKVEGPLINYFNEFPALKQPEGYQLLCEDFSVKFPGKEEILTSSLILKRDQIIHIAREKLNNTRDNDLKESILRYLDSITDDKPDSKSEVALLLLPYILPILPSRKKGNHIHWKPSRSEIRDGFITHVSSSAEVKPTIEQRQIKLSRLGRTFQPIIILVGTKYPEESEAVWLTVQRLFYEIITEAKLTDFEYGPDTSSSPPNCIQLDGSVPKLKTSASEMLTLVRYFGLIFGYYVPRENDVWLLYLCLREMLDKLLNHRVFSDAKHHLPNLVATLNQ
ncbi:hypothetical protein EVAR_22444_1 [Eumeta japonica]|uniref:Uncharacterized protein n=1 Tax=Eumeta variegata TaxID=151549 RepID=A0A4C1VDF4_EUMVA|nr:hypothetical protein EVAR_22444_1 [Eumeta japonica]